MPQLQLLMEILNLESCDFIQYKPEEITWPKPVEFVVTHVKRDREWFAEKLPIMEVRGLGLKKGGWISSTPCSSQAFWKRVLYHREHGVEGLMKPPRAPRAKKAKVVPTTSRIQEYEEDQESSESEVDQEPAAPPATSRDEEEEPEVEREEPWDYSYL
jgi:hypothetical protein